MRKDPLFMKPVLFIIAILALISCNFDRSFTETDRQRIAEEVSDMLNNYYSAIKSEGLMAEFDFLDDSPDFFWNPPGYNSALSYDSVKAEVERNAAQFRSANFRWDMLRVVPLSIDIATYSGIVHGELTDTTGHEIRVSLKESGTVIRRKSGWKILNGHTSALNYPIEELSNTSTKQETMKRVTGIGGIFFKAENPEKIKEWYNTYLGFDTDQWGTNFEWRQGADPEKYGFTQWSPFSQNTSYFEPSEKEFMINYRVENLEALVEQLKKEGVTVLDEIAEYEYGKFVHILDLEGNKVELWEPEDVVYDKLVKGRTK